MEEKQEVRSSRFEGRMKKRCLLLTSSFALRTSNFLRAGAAETARFEVRGKNEEAGASFLPLRSHLAPRISAGRGWRRTKRCEVRGKNEEAGASFLTSSLAPRTSNLLRVGVEEKTRGAKFEVRTK